jgi:serine/threonine protein kinase
VKKLEDPHLVRILKAYKHGDTFNLIFPCAKTNLEMYLRDELYEAPQPSGDRIELSPLWSQLLGLANALEKIINYHSPQLTSGEQRLYGYHFDLKPANILVEDSGTFIISDFSQATFKDVGGTSKVSGMGGTEAYAPPEIDGRDGYNRKYDIWSLGCIFVEVCTFAVKGFGGINQFDKLRVTSTGANRYDDRFICRIDGTNRYQIKPGIRKWVEGLPNSDSIHNEQSRDFLKELVGLMMKMLDVNVRQRSTSREVCQDLSLILKRYQPVPVNRPARVGTDLSLPPDELGFGKDVICEDLNSEDEASDDTSMFSVLSKSSTSTQPSISDTFAAALHEITTVFLEDEDIQRLFSKALANQGHDNALQYATRLLTWLGRRLKEVSCTPVEKEVARIFSSQRHNRTVVDRVAQEIQSGVVDDEKQRAMDKLREQRIERRETLDLFFREVEIREVERNGPGDDRGNIINGSESDDSTDGEDEPQAGVRNVSSNVEAALGFLKSSEAYTRFKEELEDFAEPFRNKTMWSKVLWDGNDLVRFEHWSSVPRLTSMDKLKLTAEQTLGMPILWWPLKQPRNHLPRTKVRIISLCVSEPDNTYGLKLKEYRNAEWKLTSMSPGLKHRDFAVGAVKYLSNTN